MTLRSTIPTLAQRARPLAFVIGLGLPVTGHAQSEAEVGYEFAAPGDDFWRLDVQPRAIAEAWWAEGPAPGLLSFDDDVFLAPRLDLMVTARAGEHWSFHLLGRWDRGFDPGSAPDGEARLDEAIARWSPLGDARLALEAGKFATVFGGWPARHDFWDSPFLSPPLPYSRVHGLSDLGDADLAEVTARLTEPDNRETWMPMVWGPSYAPGVAAFGAVGAFDYALEVKNTALSSRPDAWQETDGFFEHPTVSARFGWRPDASMAFGVSASRGSFLSRDSAFDADDFTQSVVGVDARWSWRHTIVQAEVLATRFDTPVGEFDVLGSYLEARQKLGPRWWLAGRLGQTTADQVDANSDSLTWERDAWRIEAALGFRWTEDRLIKLEYGHASESGAQPQGENTVGLAVGARF